MRNIGLVGAAGVSVDLTSGTDYVEILTGTASFGDIPAGGSGTNAEPFLFRVSPDVPDGTPLLLWASFSDDPGLLRLGLDAHAPAYLVGVSAIDDLGGGNGNGIADPGEVVSAALRFENVGRSAAPALGVLVGPGAPYLDPDELEHPLDVVPAGGTATLTGLEVSVAPDCPPEHADYLQLTLSDGADYAVAFPVGFSVGQTWGDEMEQPSASWHHHAGEGDWSDAWHPETYRNHTPGGQASWKCGGEGATDYGSLLHARLETAEFDLFPYSVLSFWHWMDAEASSYYPDSCYDGGRLEISADGGTTWEPLLPEGGYSHIVRGGSIPGPFPAGTPVWSGEHGWEQVFVDLGGYAGAVKLRFSFGSDGAVTAEGWYLDDLRVYRGEPAGAPSRVPVRAGRPTLLPARPSPFAASGTTAGGHGPLTLRFVLPHPVTASLAIYDASGRTVRRLGTKDYPAGEHRLTWNGLDAHGAPAPTGTYYCRLRAGGHEQAQPVVIVR